MQDSQETVISWHPVGDAMVIQVEADNCSSAADGEWWDNNDMHLAHTNKERGNCLLDKTRYAKDIDHLPRNGRYFKPTHIDQAMVSRKDRYVEK